MAIEYFSIFPSTTPPERRKGIALHSKCKLLPTPYLRLFTAIRHSSHNPSFEDVVTGQGGSRGGAIKGRGK